MGETANPVPVIQVEAIKKTYGHHAALKQVGFSADAGESIVIFGPNGAGKTTLIKIIATIIRPTAGRVRVNGLDPETDAEAIRRCIGVITHQTFLYGNLTAYENLVFYARLYDVPDAPARLACSTWPARCGSPSGPAAARWDGRDRTPGPAARERAPRR